MRLLTNLTRTKMANKKKKVNNNLNMIFIIILSTLVTFIFVKILIPLVESIIGIFISLSKLYPLVDLNFKFIGGFFFLFIFWYILESVITITMSIIRKIKTLFNEIEFKNKTKQKRVRMQSD